MTMGAVHKRYATDDAFREVADLLFGSGHEISKANPDGADLSAARKKSERRQAQVGLASNVVGLGAGVMGTKEAFGTFKEVKGVKNGATLHPKPIKISGKTKAAAGAALGLQVANVGGDMVANRVLARSAKKDTKKVSKGLLSPINKAEKSTTQGMPEQASFPTKGKLTRATVTTAARASGKGAAYTKGHFKLLPQKLGSKGAGDKVKEVKKNDLDIKWAGEISKVNADKQQVFGWASIVEMNGEPVVDLQGDYISIEEVEKAGYDYVQKSRKGGDMHLRDGFDQPIHASEMIESFIVTPDKKEALGLPDDMPTGWWVGYQVNDPAVWAKVKSGERTGFSIHGRGQRS